VEYFAFASAFAFLQEHPRLENHGNSISMAPTPCFCSCYYFAFASAFAFLHEHPRLESRGNSIFLT